MKSIVAAATVAFAVAGCASAAESVGADALGITARDAYAEARSVGRSWSDGARLRWVEGVDIAPSGLALPDGGAWRFHYTAADRTGGVVVTVTPLGVAEEEGPPASPPGLIIGDAALSTTWIDSPAVMEAIEGASGGIGGPGALYLVPARPERWIVRNGDGDRWEIEAGTGAVLRP
jgi:hypothetical protein